MGAVLTKNSKAFFTRMEPAETQCRWRNGSEKCFRAGSEFETEALGSRGQPELLEK